MRPTLLEVAPPKMKAWAGRMAELPAVKANAAARPAVEAPKL